MKTLVNSLNSNPLAALILAMIGISTGTGLHYTHVMLEAAATTSPQAIDYVVKVFQCFAFAGGGLAGFVSFHGWWGKNKKKIN